MLPPKLFQIGASLYIIGKILFKKSSYPGIGILLITAKALKSLMASLRQTRHELLPSAVALR